MTEDQIFDATRRAPAALLRQIYEDHQVLVLSYREHFNERPYRALALLLDQVGHDPRLRYIAIETGGGVGEEIAPVLEAASVTDMAEPLPRRLQLGPVKREQLLQWLAPEQLAVFENPIGILCRGEGSYVWNVILPRLRALNAARPAGRKVLVTNVDGKLTSTMLHRNPFDNSYERDSVTATVFGAKIWRELRRERSAKAIVLYHIGHTMQGYTARRSGRTIAPNFLSTFLRDHPEAKPRTAVVMIEGTGDSGRGDRYEFKFTERQLRRSDQPFGVRTAPFRAVETERGDSALAGNAILELLNPTGALGPGSTVQSTTTLPEMVDAIVWLPRSEQLSMKEMRSIGTGQCP